MKKSSGVTFRRDCTYCKSAKKIFQVFSHMKIANALDNLRNDIKILMKLNPPQERTPE